MTSEEERAWSIHCTLSSLIRHGALTVDQLSQNLVLLQRDNERLREEIAELKAALANRAG